MSFHRENISSIKTSNIVPAIKKSKLDKFAECKKEIDIYNCCIREIKKEDSVHKCDDYMINIQLCMKTQQK